MSYLDLNNDIFHLILSKLMILDIINVGINHKINYKILFRLLREDLYKDINLISQNDNILQHDDGWKIAFYSFEDYNNNKELHDSQLPIYYDMKIPRDGLQLVYKYKLYKSNSKLFNLLILNKDLNTCTKFGIKKYKLELFNILYEFEYFDWIDMYRLYKYNMLYGINNFIYLTSLNNYIEVLDYILSIHPEYVDVLTGISNILDHFYLIKNIEICFVKLVKYLIGRLEYKNTFDHPYILKNLYSKGNVNLFKLIFENNIPLFISPTNMEVIPNYVNIIDLIYNEFTFLYKKERMEIVKYIRQFIIEEDMLKRLDNISIRLFLRDDYTPNATDNIIFNCYSYSTSPGIIKNNELSLYIKNVNICYY
jgi:hypothetical protein